MTNGCSPFPTFPPAHLLTRSPALLLLVALSFFSAAHLRAATVDTVVSGNLLEPHTAVVAPNDLLYISDGANHRIVRYDVGNGTFTSLAGLSGTPGTNIGTGLMARFYQPQGMIMARGGLIVADSANNMIRYVSLTGAVTNLAGLPLQPGHVNGAAGTSRFRYPLGLANDANGNIYIADSMNNAIRKLDTANSVSTLAATNLVQADTIVIPNLYQPAAVAVTPDGYLWIANTRNHVIQRIDLNTRTYLDVAGISGQAGTNDSLLASESLLNSPKGLYWSSTSTNLLICDTGNNAVRRLYFNGEMGTWSMTTFAGVPGQAGFVNGLALIARFSAPMGLTYDAMNRSFIVADRANNAIRRIQESPPLPPIGAPSIGVVRFQPDANGVLRTVLVPVTSQVFYNDEIIAMTYEQQTLTYYSGGPTPADPLLDLIPNPGPSVSPMDPYFAGIAWTYANGVTMGDFLNFYNTVPAADKIGARPDFTLKGMGGAPGRRSSAIIKARFVFQVARPAIAGDNAADFIVQDTTEDAELWYTYDGSEPTNRPPARLLTGLHPTDFPPPVTNVIMLKVQGFKANYLPSIVASNLYWPSNYVPNRITFGFESGEASCDFEGTVGQRFYAPVTLSLLPNQRIYSMQFSASVSNSAGLPVPGNALGFHSMLVKPVLGKTSIYTNIPAVVSLGGLQIAPVTNVTEITTTTNTAASGGTNYISVATHFTSYGPYGVTNWDDFSSYISFLNTDPPIHAGVTQTNIELADVLWDFGWTNLVATNHSTALLGVGWLERYGRSVLYNTLQQDLINFSQPHNRIFDPRADQKVVLGSFSFPISSLAAVGEIYHLRVDRPSATSDGIYQNLPISVWTNGTHGAGAINSLKNIRVRSGSRPYLVGDVEPFRWLNAGEFGETNLLNNDVMQVFQSAVYGYNKPGAGSDFFDAMDSSDGMTSGHLNPGPGNDFLLDTIHFGDGELNVDDVYVTFRRSLDPAVKWFVRYWTNDLVNWPTAKAWAEVPNRAPAGKSAPAATSAPKTTPIPGVAPAAEFSAEDVAGSGGRVLQVPIRARITGGVPVVVLMLSLSAEPLDGSPALTAPLQFSPAGGLGAPTLTTSSGTNNYATAWLNAAAGGVSGTNLIGTLTVTLPAGAPASAAYRIHFEHVSASPNGLGLFPVQVRDGLLTATDRSASSWGDGIPDAWRLRFFGALDNLLSAASADADGDGVSNWAEFRAGTDPVNRLSRLHLTPAVLRTNNATGIRLRWPTGAGRRYVLESSTTFGSGLWTPVATNLLGDGSVREFLDTNAAAPARFYRVRVAE